MKHQVVAVCGLAYTCCMPVFGFMTGTGDCTGISCTGVSTGTWSASTTIVPDTIPAIIIPIYNGSTSNPLRVSSWWYDEDYTNPTKTPVDSAPSNGIPDVFDELLAQLNECYDRGFRRIVLQLPAGNPGGIWPSSQYWTMPEWKRDGLTDYVKTWIEAKEDDDDPVSLCIIGGFRLNTTTPNACKYSVTENSSVDTTDIDQMCTVYKNISPWIDMGVAEYWFDGSAGDTRWQSLITFPNDPDYSSAIKFMGEAIPFDIDSAPCDDLTLNSTAIDAMPWYADFSYVERRMPNKVINDSIHELHVLLTGHPADPCTAGANYHWDMESAIRYRDNGWVVGTQYVRRTANYDSASFDYTTPYTSVGGVTSNRNFFEAETIQRLYGFGPLLSLADFDGDGFMEVGTMEDDYLLFLNQYSNNYHTYGTYIQGDVNGDGYIDNDDVVDFFDAVDEWVNNGTVVPIDLGDPDWVP